MAEIDMSKCTPEQRRSYQRMMRHAGKGSAPRNIWSQDFRNNYDAINWHSSGQREPKWTNPQEIKLTPW